MWPLATWSLSRSALFVCTTFQLEPEDVGVWVDYWFLLVFGGIPWQCYYQRVLSAKSSNRAIFLSFGGAAIALIMTGSN